MGSREFEFNDTLMTCARNYLVSWGDGNLKVMNTSFYYGGDNKAVLFLNGESGLKNRIESYRIQNGGALFMASNERTVFLYEVVLPYKTAAPFDFGNVRFFV